MLEQMNKFSINNNNLPRQQQKQQKQQIQISDVTSAAFSNGKITMNNDFANDLFGSNSSNVIGNDRCSIVSTSSSSSNIDDMNNMFTKFAFPFKLHSILEHSENSNQTDVISWLPSGRGFKIHMPKLFAETILPLYFNRTKYRSFQRQLYIYGFDRVKDKNSKDYGAYYHDLFIRGFRDLCLDMQRKKIKGTGLSNEERRRKAALSKNQSNKETMSKDKKPANAAPDSNINGTKKNVNAERRPSIAPSQKRSSIVKSSQPTLSSLTSAFDHAMPVLWGKAARYPSDLLSPSSMHPSRGLQSSSAVDTKPQQWQPQHQLSPRRISEWTDELGHLQEQLQQLQQQQLLHNLQQQRQQQQIPGAPRRVSDWSNDVSGMNLLQQHQANNNKNTQSNIKGALQNVVGSTESSRSDYESIGRRCSLGFVRSSGRRGSLLHDGDEVCFNGKNFFFTSDY